MILLWGYKDKVFICTWIFFFFSPCLKPKLVLMIFGAVRIRYLTVERNYIFWKNLKAKSEKDYLFYLKNKERDEAQTI